jgi:hypothetical protein
MHACAMSTYEEDDDEPELDEPEDDDDLEPVDDETE